MDHIVSNSTHDAAAAAQGFYYQAQFALLTLISQTSESVAVAVERLDDVELKVDGQKLLYQLKHSVQQNPPAITLSCVALWKTIRVWIDALPFLCLAETTFHLVAVGKIPADSPLLTLCDMGSDRQALLTAMIHEAQRVVDERATVKAVGEKPRHSTRAAGCDAFLKLDPSTKLNLLRRICIKQDSITIGQILGAIAKRLHLIPWQQRALVAERLLEWWDLQVIYTLCNKRERAIQRIEMEQRISSIIGDIEEDKLVADFSIATHPDDYEPDGMLIRQISLVGGKPSDITRAIREQWRRRSSVQSGSLIIRKCARLLSATTPSSPSSGQIDMCV